MGPVRSTHQETSWILDAVRRREADLADACATAAVHVRDTRVAGKLAELVFEHLRHARPQFECTNVCAVEVDAATLRGRTRRQYSHYAPADASVVAAVDGAMAGAIARAHAEIALFIDDACASLLVSPADRERLLRIAFCTAAMGEGLNL
jgi:hypothetical protein